VKETTVEDTAVEYTSVELDRMAILGMVVAADELVAQVVCPPSMCTGARSLGLCRMLPPTLEQSPTLRAVSDYLMQLDAHTKVYCREIAALVDDAFSQTCDVAHGVKFRLMHGTDGH